MNMKLTTLVLAGSMAVSLSAFAAKGAAYVAPAAEPEMARWTITGGATYLTPSLNGLDYLGVTQNYDQADEIASAKTYRLEPGYDFGYFLGVGYMISDRYDVQATWAQFNSESSDSTLVSGEPGNVLVATSSFHDNTLNSDEQFNAHAQETLNFQVFDATLGQYHKLGDNLMTRVFAGVRYAKIENNTLNQYQHSFINEILNSMSDSYDSSFSGVGPEVGLDMNYAVYDWFGIVGHFAAAFLVGQQDTDSNVWSGADLSEHTKTLIDADNGTIMVPAIDAKLGVNLGVPFMDMQDRFMIEAGYQVAYYFNSVDQLIKNENDDLIHNVSDVGMMGPYLNMGFKF